MVEKLCVEIAMEHRTEGLLRLRNGRWQIDYRRDYIIEYPTDHDRVESHNQKPRKRLKAGILPQMLALWCQLFKR